MRRQSWIAGIVPGALFALALLAPAVPATPAEAREAGKIRTAGTLNVEGRCRILTDDSGRQFALVGDLGAFTTGDRIQVVGTLGAPSPCTEGASLKVESARADVPRRASLPAGRPGVPRTVAFPEAPAPGFSPLFLARKGKGSVAVRGTLTGEGVECQALRGSDGQLYTLTGNLKGFNIGDRVRVSGSFAEVSTCQQGRTITVEKIQMDEEHGDEPEARVRHEVIALTGHLTAEGIECQAFRSEQGELYTLTGDLKGFKTGDRVQLAARQVDGGACQGQGRVLQVKMIRRAEK